MRALVDARAPMLRSLTLAWFGGEPLYGWEAVEELAPALQRTARERGMAFNHGMTTNAYLLTEERATKLLEWGCTHYQITIDGLPGEHDCKRVGRDGSPTYAVILDNLRALKARRGAEFVAIIRVNFDTDNLPRLGPFIEALSEDFAGDPRFRLHFRPIGRWGGPNDDHLTTCGLAEHREVSDVLRHRAVELGLRTEGGVEEMRHPGTQVCYAARPYSFVVGATGKLMKCTIALDEMPENVVGRILPDGALEIDDERFVKWVTPYYEEDKVCRSCYVLPGCQGGACPLTRIRDGERTCCSVKSNLKREMRFSLDTIQRARVAAQAAAQAPSPEQAEAAAAD